MLHRRRWFQFSTRSLLLLLTGLCAWLGYLSESARRQRDAVATLTPVAALAYDDGSVLSGKHREIKVRTGASGLFERYLGKDYFDRVTQVYFFRSAVIAPEHLDAVINLGSVHELMLIDNESVDDAIVSRLVRVPRLRELFVSGTPITDASFQPISQMPRLELLGANDTYINGSGFRSLQASPSLSYLTLRNTEVTDKHLDDLGGCNRLRYVDLRDTRVSASGIARLQKALPTCEIRWRDWRD